MENQTPLQAMIMRFEESRLSYGDHINHTDIDNWCALEYPDVDGLPRYEQKIAINGYALKRLTLVEGLKENLLRERLMYLKTVQGSGYLIVQPADQTEAAVNKGVRQITKGLKHAIRGVEQVNTAMLTAPEREYNSSVKARLAGLGILIGRKKDYLTIK